MRMNASMTTFVLLGAMLACQSGVESAEYFVNKQGDDANNGGSRQTAFLTIQKGVDALKPGDTLTIGPGEYFENVNRAGLGSPDADTVIRAEIPGTATLRGDVPAPEFKKMAGYRFVYSAPFDHAPKAVLERDTLKILNGRANMRELEYDPSSFFYEAEAKRLYISTSDLRPADQHHYTVGVKGDGGLVLSNPQRVVIEGLAVVGYVPGWGIDFTMPISCVIRDCVTYLNVGGIVLGHSGGNEGNGGMKNLVERCVCYGNTFGGVVRYHGKDDVIRNCYTYRNGESGEHFGIMHYHTMYGSLLIKDSIAWGHSFNISVKPSQQERIENCVALGFVRIEPEKTFNSLIGGGNEYDLQSTSPARNILFVQEKGLDRDFEFADPLNMDFRLQADSRFRGKASDKNDRGPYPYQANIYYLSPTGDDKADGLSMRKPWRTLDRALKCLRPADTLYLAEGEYAAAAWSKAGDGKSPIQIRGRGRGRGTIVIKGKLSLSGGAGMMFERLNFTDGVALADSRDVVFKNCSFSGNDLVVQGTKGLRVTHCVFAESPLQLKKSGGAFLSGNLYANAKGAAVVLDAADAVLYSDYNSYQNEAKCWAVSGETQPLSTVRTQHERYSLVIAPELDRKEGAVKVENAYQFKGRGPHATTLGIYREDEFETLSMVGPFLHSTTATTANLEWWTSSPTNYKITWGETPKMEHTFSTYQCNDCFTTYSLTGLKPETKYYFRVVPASSSAKVGGEISFTTVPSVVEVTTYHVAPDGSDENDGRSRGKALRTVTHAADVARPGDTVLISEGTYAETVRLRATGEKDRPITFRSAPHERVTFNGTNLAEGFRVMGKKAINLDGFYFTNFGDSRHVFLLWKADQVKITRCFDVVGNGYGNFLSGTFCEDLLVKNCIAAGGMSIIDLHVCPGFHVENNLLIRPYITDLNFVNEPQQKGYFRKNIVTDGLPTKMGAPLVTCGRFESLMEENNCYMVRLPVEERKIYCFYGPAAYGRYKENYGVKTTFDKPPVFADHPDGTENNPQITLVEFQKMVGDNGSYVGDPKCAGTLRMEAGGKLWTGHSSQMFDKLLEKKDLDFPDSFVTDPKAKEKGIGPVPEDFKDFWFNKKR